MLKSASVLEAEEASADEAPMDEDGIAEQEEVAATTTTS